MGNQVPLQLLKNAIAAIHTGPIPFGRLNDKLEVDIKHLIETVSMFNEICVTINPTDDISIIQCDHIFGCMYKIMTFGESTNYSYRVYKDILNISRLRFSGVKICASIGRLTSVQFDEYYNTIFIPEASIYRHTECYI